MNKLLALLIMSPWLIQQILNLLNKCIESNLIELTQSDKFKSSNFIRYERVPR